MPRPKDNYAHDQFEIVECNRGVPGETIQCVHCRVWTGNIKVLSRKKDHLAVCPAYAAWRAAGNGEELAPPNKYTPRKEGERKAEGMYTSPYNGYNPSPSAAVPWTKNIDLSQYYDEWTEEVGGQKCPRYRCKACGETRAKNTTRQFEHLEACTSFKDSPEGAAYHFNHLAASQQTSAASATTTNAAKFRAPVKGNAMNGSTGTSGFGRFSVVKPAPTGKPAPKKSQAPSLVNFLLLKYRTEVDSALHVDFLEQAGAHTLSRSDLEYWLLQQGFVARALATFIGNIIGKIRLPDYVEAQNSSEYRAFDLLCSALNNAKRELDFIVMTRERYELVGARAKQETPKPPTKGFLDLFASAASPSASLLEGLIVLWAVQHLYRSSWRHAAAFITPDLQFSQPTSSYSLPSYMSKHPVPYQTPNTQQPEHAHIAALRDNLIPNWTSDGFSKFVDACKALVDEIANAQTSGNGAGELQRCELHFQQVTWLWKQMFPTARAKVEADPPVDPQNAATAQMGVNGTQQGTNKASVVVDDDEDEQNSQIDASGDSLFGGTGLEAVDAHNRAT